MGPNGDGIDDLPAAELVLQRHRVFVGLDQQRTDVGIVAHHAMGIGGAELERRGRDLVRGEADLRIEARDSRAGESRIVEVAGVKVEAVEQSARLKFFEMKVRRWTPTR